MRTISGKARSLAPSGRNRAAGARIGTGVRTVRTCLDMARPRTDTRTYFYRKMSKQEVQKFAVVCTATLVSWYRRVGDIRDAMTAALREVAVSVRKADPVSDAKVLPALTLLIVEMPRIQGGQGPTAGPVVPRPFSEYLDMEVKTATILKQLASLAENRQHVPRTQPISPNIPSAASLVTTDHPRYFNEAHGFFSQVQAYRHRTRDADLAGTAPSAEQVAACLAELKSNDKDFQQYSYYLNHPNNKPNAINKTANVDFVDAGILASMVPKGKRVNSDLIFTPEFRKELVQKFQLNGSNVIVRADTFLKILCKFGYIGRPTPSPDLPNGDGELFNTEDAAISEIFDRLGPDASEEDISRTTEVVLGFNPGDLNATLVHIKIPPLAVKNPRIASGNEHGANHLWLFGASTPMGHTELISDRVNLAGIPGTEPNDTAPTVRILGPRGKGIAVNPANYLDIRDRLIAFESSGAKELHKRL
jgi:hypothetical protein